jgi:hypothetical protein
MKKGESASALPDRDQDRRHVPRIVRIPGMQEGELAPTAQFTDAPIFPGIAKISGASKTTIIYHGHCSY